MKHKMLLSYFQMLLVGLLLTEPLWAADISNVRIWRAPDNTRLVFDLTGPVSHKIFPLHNPERLVLDIPKAGVKAKLDEVSLAGSPIQKIRTGTTDNTLRIVLELKEPVKPRSFELKPNDQYGHRLVVDLFDTGKKTQIKTATPPEKGDKLRDIVIAIDAGHGGEDPGAIGPGKIQEKNVVLAIAKELKRLVDAEKGFKAELIRTGDYYISLRGRTKKAREQNADLFISVHADAFKDSRARGASVWVLSSRGASSEMGRWLARKENSADLIGGVGGGLSLEDKDDVLAGVLLDMSMSASRSYSQQVAKRIHQNIDSFARMHKKKVQHAGFLVLKSPDIPSILVETGFISNPYEAKQLGSAAYRKKMAKAIFSGIHAHFWNHPPAYTYVAQRKTEGYNAKGEQVGKHYKVVKGDTLSVIATRHGVSLTGLRRVNALKNDTIRVGQVLQIPST